MVLDELLDIVPPETEKYVARVRDRFNQNIREAIRQETGLRFRPKSRAGDIQPTEFINVQVRVVPGLPTALHWREIPHAHRVAAKLAPWRHTLEQLCESGAKTRQHVLPILRADFYLDDLAESRLKDTEEFAKHLLSLVQGFNLAAWMLEVDEDVLGAYIYNAGPEIPPDKLESHVELYWAAIGLMARILGVAVEALTVVVLAHELAHAYTHRAADIDGHVWDAMAFAKSDHDLKEGLAQYYTARVCERLSVAAPEAAAAYKALLPNQPAAYQNHLPWLKDSNPEAVRLALLVARRTGEMELAGFNGALSGPGKHLLSKKAVR